MPIRPTTKLPSVLAFTLLLTVAGCGAEDDTRVDQDASSDAVDQDASSDAVDQDASSDAEVAMTCEVADSTTRDVDFQFEGCLIYQSGISEISTVDELDTPFGRSLQECVNSFGNRFDLSSVDFEQNKIVLGSTWIGETCRMTIDRAAVYESPTHAGIEMWTIDHSGSCEVVCGMRSGTTVGAVVQRDLQILDCLFTIDACD